MPPVENITAVPLATALHNAESLHKQGIALLQRRDGAESAAIFRELIALRPWCAQTWNNFGISLYQTGDIARAIRCYCRALEIAPGFAAAAVNLGNAYLFQGQVEQAIAMYRHALCLNPEMPEVHCNLGIAFKEQGRLIDAEICYTKSLALDPNQPATHFNLATLWESQENLAGATSHYDECLRLHPQRRLRALRKITICPTVFPNNVAIDNYRSALKCKLDDFSEQREAFDLNELDVDACAPPFNLPYQGRDDRPLKEAFARIYQDRIRDLTSKCSSRPDGQGRIGFVVTHGHEHAMLRCLGGVLDQLPIDLGQLFVFCDERSDSTLRFGLDTRRVEIVSVTRQLPSFANAIREARLDVLYHWEAGTDKTNYLLPFLRLAPVQCTSFGIPETSGIPEMDYYLSSSWVEEPEASNDYTEKLICLDAMLSYDRRRPLYGKRKTAGDFGLPKDRHIYLCPQYLGKFHPDFDPILGNVLRQDDVGVIAVVSKAPFAALQQLRNRLSVSCPDVADRVLFVKFQSDADYLQLLALSHVVLDPLYYGGVITTYDAFAVGTPVVTLPTRFQRGRHAAALYRQMGLDVGVASGAADYVQRAISLATNDDVRHSVHEMLESRYEVILEDRRVVHAYAECFRRLLDEARSAAVATRHS